MSERALVLLLPTEIWIPAGVAAVAATALLVALTPAAFLRRASAVRSLRIPAPSAGEAFSLASAALLLALVVLGWIGPRDPLGNLLPLTVWTLFFVAFPLLQAAVGDLWSALNPWTGPHRLLMGGASPPLRLPPRLGRWPALVAWLAISGFALADPAPADPAHLAAAVGFYWAAILALLTLFGRDALPRVEGFTVWLSLFAALAPLRARNGRLALSLPAARLVRAPASASLGVFTVAALGAGSFDGLNETFWWLALIGVNPLEFPGRSAVIPQTLGGLILSAALLTAVFAACVAAGLALAGRAALFPRAFGRFALTLAPILAGYHAAHYLTGFLVNAQYALAAATDPLATGADLLGLGPFRVTTSFFNLYRTVRLIWLAQAGAVVLGHILGVLAAHAVALDLLGDPRRAALSQVPLAGFMILYTLFGLWLLAQPTGA